jgi:hypothetical protein
MDIISAIETNAKIEKTGQLLLCNNLLLSSIVSPQQEIGTYTMKMDANNPLVVFDLKTSFEKSNFDAFVDSELNVFVVGVINKIIFFSSATDALKNAK